MVAVKLLEEARAAGLKLRAEGDRLIVRGPKTAERVAKALLERKAEILLLLNPPPASPVTYAEMVKQMPDNMALVDSWLCDAHPALWRKIRELDDALTCQEETTARYQQGLQKLLALCWEAKTLKDRIWDALLVKSQVLGCDVWVVRNEAALRLVDTALPVFFADEFETLKGKSTKQLQDVLRTKQAFPGCRVVQ